MTGWVSDIQRCSFHDGPGLRTTVFLKGCNLHCAWCHNPETLRLAAELEVFPERCLGCGACIEACPNGAHVLAGGERRFLRERCTGCGACAEVCYAGALVRVGRRMTADDVLAEVLEDRAFYGRSGGGVTISGGEPLCQPAFAGELLRRAKAEGLHTAIETNGAYPWEHLADVLDATDLVMMDIKLIDPAEHMRWTGASNELVLANARRLSEVHPVWIARTPVVPGVNDTEEAIGEIAAFLAGLGGAVRYELLPYHPLGTGKYARLGMEYSLAGVSAPGPEPMARLAAAARASGADTHVAGRPTAP